MRSIPFSYCDTLNMSPAEIIIIIRFLRAEINWYGLWKEKQINNISDLWKSVEK